jgi:flagellar hook-associated protein 1 FlgK
MSINSILNIGTSGLNAAQAKLKVVADNIANVDTPGYVRKLADQTAYQSNGVGAGVDIARIRRATNAFLQAAAYAAAAGLGKAKISSDQIDRAQSLFGDLTANQNYFKRLDGIYADFNSLAASPTDGLKKSGAVTNITNFLNESRSIYTSLQAIQSDADGQIKTNVETINGLLVDIDKLNTEIRAGTTTNADVTGSLNAQGVLIKQLSSLMDIRVSNLPQGGVSILGGDSLNLVGPNGPASLAYVPKGNGFGDVTVTESGGTPKSLVDRMTSGEMIGLIQLRDKELPAVMNQLGQLVSQASEALNKAHNAASTVPALQTLSGRNTGLDLATGISGFTGTTTVAVMNNTTNLITKSVKIDFTAGTITVDAGAPTNFTPANFLATLNTALGTDATASFANNALSLSAAAGKGIAIADAAATPATKAGKGFSQFFGLNDLIQSSGISSYDTGLTNASDPGFTPGKVLSLRLSDASGKTLADVNITTPAGTTMASLLAAMNDPNTGVGKYGSYALDSVGQLRFTPLGTAAVSVSVQSDTTTRGAGTPSISQLFGIGDNQRASRLFGYSVRSDIAADPGKLALAKLDLAPPVGQANLKVGDGSGAQALANSGSTLASFDPAGNILGGVKTISQYAAQFAGALAQRASLAQSAQTSALSLAVEVETRRSSVEDVNQDEELAKLTTYQQSYNASARLVTAAKDIYDILLNMVGG